MPNIFFGGRAGIALAAIALSCMLPRIASAQRADADTIVSVSSGSTGSFRGISVAPDGTVWLGGSSGTVLRSLDHGGSWSTIAAPDGVTFDFRDVHAVSRDTAYFMVAAQDTARIYKTNDAGAHWTLQYDRVGPGMFLDGLAFFDSMHGFAFGDPVDGHFVVLRTADGGTTWVSADASQLPASVTGEAAFAASGTSITIAAPRTIAFATGGGSVSRLFRSVDDGRTWKVHDTPLPTGAGGAGIFSLAFRDGRHGIAVGGNYQAPDSARANVAMTKDGGVTWTLGDLKRTVPYVSAVVYAGNHAFATGPGGTFRSDDDGATWRRIGTTGFNAIGVTRDGLIFVGQDGAVGRLQLRR